MLGAVALKIMECRDARTFSFPYCSVRVSKRLFFAERGHRLYGFIVCLDGLIVGVKELNSLFAWRSISQFFALRTVALQMCKIDDCLRVRPEGMALGDERCPIRH